MNRIALWAAMLTLICAASFRATAEPDPYQLMARARAVWLSQQYPAWISYTIAVTVNDGGVLKTSHYKAFYDSLHANIDVSAVSVEEQADPHVPAGVNLSIRPKRNFQTLFVKPVGRAEDAIDFLGVPRLAPNYSFGIAPYVAGVTEQSDAEQRAALVRAIRDEYNDPMPAEKAQVLEHDQPLKEIANVSTANRNYVVSFTGVENVNGRDNYHLSLRPVHSSARLRLREMWIDTETFGTSEVITQGNFNRFGSVPWTITFQFVNGYQYIYAETANAPVSLGRHTYSNATIRFESITAGQPSMIAPFAPAANALEEPRT